MEGLAKEVRKFVYDRMCDTSYPPLLEEIMGRFELTRGRAKQILKALQAENQVVLLAGTDRILMAHPFSAISSPFRVTLSDGRAFFANCSWDSIAMHVMLGRDVRIDSFCHHSGAKIAIELSNGTVESAQPEGTIVYLGLPAARWWQDIVHTCSNTMVYFGSRAHLDEWLTVNRIEKPGETLTIEKTIALSGPLYQRKMDLDYQRPSASELRRHFAGLGLAGAFWDI
ncbi:MAG: alkylmercury lyase family protein [Kiloniellaceae bacterium]